MEGDMVTNVVDMVSRFLLALVRFWISFVVFVIFFVFVPMVLLWLVFFVVYAERAGQAPFWR